MSFQTVIGVLLSSLILYYADPTAAQSRVMTGDYVGCLTLDALEEMTRAQNLRDTRQIEALGDVCENLKGREYSVIQEYWDWQKARIRVYSGGTSAVFWVPVEATFR